jgi:dihydropyrimidinase
LKTIIQNGTIFTVADIYKGDILIENGVITAIADHIIPEKDVQVIDASGQYLFPRG